MQRMLFVTLVTVFMASQAQADQHQSLGGLILGAGGGAIMGQAIGRNTQSTVVGTAVGSVIGYIIGSEMEKDSHVRTRTVSHQSTPVIHKQTQVTRYEYYEPYVTYNPRRSPVNNHQYQYSTKCREAEILGTINGKARKMTGTVCRTQNGWELVSEPVSYRDDFRQQSSWKKHKKIKKQYRQERSWVKHRF